MHLSTLVEMLDSGLGDRVLIGAGDEELTGNELGSLVRRTATSLRSSGSLVYAGENQSYLPVPFLAAAWRGIPFVPLNYRMDDTNLVELIERQVDPLVLADDRTGDRLRSAGINAVDLADWISDTTTVETTDEPAVDDDQVAVVLYTSGTTAAPKAALLRHRHLMAYLLGSVEFAAADPTDAVLISVPPYHIAGVANMLSNLFAGRRLHYLQHFSPTAWLSATGELAITHAMVVPTMLAQVLDCLEGTADLPVLRTLSYGGSKVPASLVERALAAFPTTGLVNAYGLTETASTIAVLGPDDHRDAYLSDEPAVRARLGSVGRVLPTIEIEIRSDENGGSLGPNERGILHVRGEQVAGEYATGRLLDANGWFCTRDAAWVDDEGFLFIEGRADDTIIRGGENIAPAEIEEALLSHAEIADACVFGIADDQWGQRIAAVIVARRSAEIDVEEVRAHVRRQLRGSKTPDIVRVADELPRTSTGKVLRRSLSEALEAEHR